MSGVGAFVTSIVSICPSDACSSGACILDAEGNAVCSESSNYGCIGNDNLKEIIGFTFLFGMVLMRRRRRRG